MGVRRGWAGMRVWRERWGSGACVRCVWMVVCATVQGEVGDGAMVVHVRFRRKKRDWLWILGGKKRD